MPKHSFETIEQMLLKCVAQGSEPELSFRLRGAELMRVAARFKGARTSLAQMRAASGILLRYESSTQRRR